MKKRILSYKEKIDTILEHPEVIEDIEALKKEHLTQIGFFMHERLIHLIVTMTFAVLTFICLGLVYIICNPAMVVLLILLLVLLIPYIMHYYLLENTVQYFYVQYDKMCELKSK